MAVAKSLAHRTAPYIPWLTVYTIAAGMLYLWGYWSKFRLNILEYIGLLDLATAAAFPLLTAIASIVLGVVLTQVFAGSAMPAGGGTETPIGRGLRRHARLLLSAYLLVVLVGFSLVATEDTRAFVVPLALSPLISFAISQQGFLSDVISDARTRTTVITILTAVACSAFGYGRTRAVEIVEGRDYLAIDTAPLSGLPDKYGKQTGDFKYLGHAGDYVVTLAPDFSLLILRAETVPHLALLHRTTRRPWPPWSEQ